MRTKTKVFLSKAKTLPYTKVGDINKKACMASVLITSEKETKS